MKDLFSKNLKFLRVNANKSQSDIGLQLKKAHTSIGNWEKGISEPSLSEIEHIAQIFEIPVADLLLKDLTEVKDNLTETRNNNPENILNEDAAPYTTAQDIIKTLSTAVKGLEAANSMLQQQVAALEKENAQLKKDIPPTRR